MAGQWQGGQWRPEENVQPHVQRQAQFPPFPESPGQYGQQPYQGQYPPQPQFPYPQPQYPYQQQLPPVFLPGYQGQPDARGYWPPPQRQRPDKRTVTVQSGSTVFHVIMTFFTGGLWIFVWLACRRKVHVTTRYR